MLHRDGGQGPRQGGSVVATSKERIISRFSAQKVFVPTLKNGEPRCTVDSILHTEVNTHTRGRK